MRWRAIVLAALLGGSAATAEAQGEKLVELGRRADSLDDAGKHAEAARVWMELWGVTEGDPTLLYVSARSLALAGDRDAAFRRVRRAIDEGVVLPKPLESDSALAVLHRDRRWRGLVAYAKSVSGMRDASLRQELLSLAARDQANRARIDSLVRRFGKPSREADSALAAMTRADAPLLGRLQQIVRTHGWPTRRLVGDDGAHAAWLILQHADSAYQQAMLPTILAAARAGQVRKSDAALLEDRVRARQGLPQRYGSQLEWSSTPGQKPRPYPIDDPACVDQRRASVQLQPLADYLRMLGAEDPPAAGPCKR